MRVLAIVARKGGVGKTTLAGHLAVEAEARGDGPVTLLDTDPQGSLSRWWNARQAETPLYTAAPLGELPARLAALKRAGVGLVMIDTPPGQPETIRGVVGLADLVLVPVRPSPHDLGAIGATIELVGKLKRPLVFVVNSAIPRSRLAAEAVEVLVESGDVAPVMVHQRQDFASSMIDGRTAGELDGKGKSAGEIRTLWRYLRRKLEMEGREDGEARVA